MLGDGCAWPPMPSMRIDHASATPRSAARTDEHRRGLFKNDRAAFERLQVLDAARAQGSKERKAAWVEKHVSRAEKQAAS